ncbi:hypothetical protein B0H67DRAFT_483193, partial [Lasiosphaeris hirsuta]
REGSVGQVEVAHKDDESVLDPLLNAPCFGCKNTDSASTTYDPSSGSHWLSTAMLYHETSRCDRTSHKERQTDLPSNPPALLTLLPAAPITPANIMLGSRPR